MKPFRYSFQKILDLKTNEKDRALQAFGESLNRLSRAEVTLQNLMRKKDEILLSLQYQKETNISTYLTYQEYLSKLDREIVQCMQKLELAKQDSERKQQMLRARTTDEKIWRNLREKAYESHREEMLRQEQIELDEAASLQYSRQFNH